MNEATCPYCNATLKKAPQRKTKCHFCEKPIFVKKMPDNRNKQLMTEDEANEAQAQWAEYHDKQRIISTLQSFGLTESDLAKEQKSFFTKKSIQQAYEALLIKITKKHPDDYYRKMAHINLAAELRKKGEDCLSHLKEATRYELLKQKRQAEQCSSDNR